MLMDMNAVFIKKIDEVKFMSINKFNSEGYYDPTAYAAMTAVEKEEKALRAFRPIVYICSPSAGAVSENIENAAASQWIMATFPLHRICCFHSFSMTII